VRLIGLVDEPRHRLYPIDGTVTATLVDDADGAPLTGAVDLPMPLDGATTGAATEYRGVIPSSVHARRRPVRDGAGARRRLARRTARSRNAS
jgi:hypothetical protein